MYQYDPHDQNFIESRAAEFRTQVVRRLDGKLSEDEFKPLRLMNGLYLQLHAYMLRVAIPYGTLSGRQMHVLGDIADKYDRGYGHFTTRQNIQFNWVNLVDTPEILDDLAQVQMHAIQTSGNCIRNVTSDPFAGASADEWVDPRPIAELLRQWSSVHPEFAFLPRKFKIAVIGAAQDRAAMKLHDIGLAAHLDADGETVVDIWVGGGQGRTPVIAELLKSDVPLNDLLPWLEAALRVYNLHGRRDNKYKARIKILVADLGISIYRASVEEELNRLDRQRFAVVPQELARIKDRFLTPDYLRLPGAPDALQQDEKTNPGFARWVDNNVFAHKVPGYAIAAISLKPTGGIPGDATGAQMRAVAELSRQYSFDEIRVSHRQNLILPHVRQDELFALWTALKEHGLEADNLDLASDIISCPGLDYCALATARSIPLSQELSQALRLREQQDDLRGLTINISGCINACGHHHVANIGILGLEKKGEEYYQITLGGENDENAAIGEILGPGFAQDQVPGVINRIIDIYLENRHSSETFGQVYARLGKQTFKEKIYASA